MAKNKKAAKGTFWADAMAEEILRHVDAHPRLGEIAAKQGILVYDEKTPSGTIHIGSSRGWILHDVIARALRDRGAPGHFVLSSDDMDPYDKPSSGLPRAEWDRHLGKPFRHIPSPVEGVFLGLQLETPSHRRRRFPGASAPTLPARRSLSTVASRRPGLRSPVP